MANIYEEIVDGLIYEIEEGDIYTVRRLKCAEYKLDILAEKSETETGILITGTIIKEYYDGTAVELVNNVNLRIAKQDLGTFSTVDGIVDFELEITNGTLDETILLIAIEEGYEHVTGDIRI